MKKAKLFMMLALLVMGVSNLFAQDVTISPQSGNLIPGYKDGRETGFAAGFSAMWRHEQLALTMTTSDNPNLTETGEGLIYPSNGITTYWGDNNDDYLVIAANKTDCYLLIALPRGYRITGYEAVLSPNLSGQSIRKRGSGTFNPVTTPTGMTFREVPKFTGDTPTNYINTVTLSDGSKDYTVSRNTANDNEELRAQNQLYFYIERPGDAYAFTIKKFVIYFTAEGTFDAKIAPSTIGPARSLVMSSFQTSKADLGKIEQHYKDNVYRYAYANTKELMGYNYLYQSDALGGSKDAEVPADVAENKHIYTTTIGGQKYFAFGEGTYFIEPPVKVFTQTGLSAPIGYRIVGADFECISGSSDEENTTEDGVVIKYNNYYLNNQLHFTSQVYKWEVDDNYNLVCPEGYLSCEGSRDTRTLSISTVSDSRFNLVAEGGYVYYLSDGGNYYYLQGNTNTEATVNVVKDLATNSRATSQATTIDINIPAVSSGSYKLEIFGTNKTTPVKTLTGGTGSYSFEDLVLNNDAVMFRISNLE